MSNYRPDIDGLRSIAVVSVVAYHAGVSAISGGYAGVDVFFVISGYLITSLILKEQLEQRFSLREFYIRRARRLFPALFAVLAASSLFAWWLLMPSEMEDFGESLATAAAFSSNFMFWSEAGYFEGPSEFKPLLHTWSLAIEEQYYLLFPLILLMCKTTARTLPVLLAAFLASLFISEAFITQSPSASFFLLPHRLWELMIGSILAAAALQKPEIFESLRPAAREALSFIGLAAITITMVGYSDDTQFPGTSALAPTLGTAGIIAAGGTTTVNRMLTARPLIAIGLISYSLYLWHWPVLVFSKTYLIRSPTPTETLAAVSASIVLAGLSWKFIERPFRQSHTKDKAVPAVNGLLTDRQVGVFSVGCIAMLIAAGLYLDRSEGMPQRLPELVTSIAKVADDKPATRKRCSGVDPKEVSVNRLCSLGVEGQPPDFILWGDSHAATLAAQFAAVAEAKGRKGLNATANGCAALLDAYLPATDAEKKCPQFNRAVLDLISDTPQIKTVFLAGRWAIYAESTRYKHESGQPMLLVDLERTADRKNRPSEEPNHIIWERSLRRTLEALRAMKKKVIVIASIPEIGWDTPNIVARSVLLDRPVNISPSIYEFEQRQQKVTPVWKSIREKVLQPRNYLCDSLKCRATDGAVPLYIDEDHLSSAGSDLLRPLVENALEWDSAPQ